MAVLSLVFIMLGQSLLKHSYSRLDSKHRINKKPKISRTLLAEVLFVINACLLIQSGITTKNIQKAQPLVKEVKTMNKLEKCCKCWS